MPIILIIAAVLIVGAGLFLFMPSKEGSEVKPSRINVPIPDYQAGDVKPNVFQNVSEAAFNKPGPNKRVCGYLIDLLVFVILGLIVKLTLKQDIHWSVLIIYWLLRDSLSGQSIGKRVVGLHVINTKGERATPVEGIVRNIPVAIPFVIILEYFVMLKNKEGRRIGDLIAHTKVMDLKPQRSDKVFLWLSLPLLLIVLGTTPFFWKNNNIAKEEGTYLGVKEEVDIPESSPFADIDLQNCSDVIDAVMKGDDRAKLAQMNAVLRDPGQYCPPVLYLLSHLLFELGEKDKAAFWFYAGQLRARFDANRCADESARTAVSELNERFGPQINQYTLQDLDKLQKTVTAVLEWDATTPYDYDHRWINLHGMKAMISALEAREGKGTSTEIMMSLPESQWEDIHKKTREEYWAGFQESFNLAIPEQEIFYVDYRSFFTGDTVQIKVSGHITTDETLFFDIVGGLEKQEKVYGRELFSEIAIKLLSVEEDKTLVKEKWTVTGPQGSHEYVVALDSTPPPGFPYKIKIDISDKKEGPDANGYYLEGMKLLQNGEFQKALEAFLAADKLRPGEPNIYNGLAMAYKKMGDNERALQYFQKSLEIEPDSPGHLVNLAFYYYDLGQCGLALPYFKKALSLNSQMDGLSQYIDECSAR